MGTVTALVSDTHIGSWTGIALHSWKCDTGELTAGGEPIYKEIIATPAQDWLYEKWLDYWAAVKALAGKRHRIVVIHLGDIVDGLHHNSPQCMPNLADQEDMAVEILKPICNMAHTAIFIRGTETHVGMMAQSEVRIAQELGAKCPFEAILDIDGLLVDVAHHGRAGRRDWTSAAAGIASQAVMEASLAGRPLPRYVFRGHNHTVDDSGEKLPGTRAVAMPSWQLRTAFGYRISAGTTSDIGGVIIRPDGQLDMSRIRYVGAPGQRTIIKL